MGGVERYVYEISTRLAKKYGFEIIIVCSNWENNEGESIFTDGVKVYRFPYLFKVSSTPINPLWNKKLNLIMERENPDVVNGHFPVPYLADIAIRIARKKNKPSILTYHNDLIGHNYLFSLLAKSYYYMLGFKTLALSQRIVVTSEYYAKDSPYLKRYSEKLRIIPPGVDIEKFRPIRTNYLKKKYGLKNEKIILFVGQLNKESRHKGLNYLIEAIKKVCGSIDAKLIIVGRGDFIEYYKRLARLYGVADKIIFEEHVYDEILPVYYSESDVVVLPSYNRAEGFGMVLIEAQACSTPVIGTTVGGIPYAVKNGESGLLVPPKDLKSLAEAIQRLLNDKNLALEMGRVGYERVRRYFTWEKSVKTFLIVIEEILGQ
jgi:glycosyltransferase involved in cell wall biosynthesis